MPYIIRVPYSYSLIRTYSLHPTLLPARVAIPSTDALSKTLVKDFKAWGWCVHHLDLTSPEATKERKQYEDYKKMDAKYHFTAKLFRVWEKEHGRLIRERERQRKGEKKGWRERVKDWWTGKNIYGSVPELGGTQKHRGRRAYTDSVMGVD